MFRAKFHAYMFSLSVGFTVSCQQEPTSPPPNADAGPNIETLTYGTILLDGSKSISNVPGDSLRFFWYTIKTPSLSNSIIENPSNKKTNFNFDIKGDYYLTLRVTDSENRIDEDTMIVFVHDRFISIDNSVINPTPAFGKTEIKLTSNVYWSATISESWITVEPNHGDPPSKTVTISWNNNPYLFSRQGYVTFSSEHTENKIFQINQQAPYLNVNVTKIEASATSGNQAVIVNANTDWVSLILIGNDWLSLDGNSGGFIVNWTVNTTGLVRNGLIQVMGPETYVAEIEVIQSN